MSEFPSPENFKINISKSQLRRLNFYGIKSDYPFVVKREKNQYVYDVDGNKYVDFFLNNGSVIAGHNSKILTKYIKNAISVSTESIFINKFYYKLIKEFTSISSFDFIQFYSSQYEGMYQLLKFLNPQNIAVNSMFLVDFIRNFFPEQKVFYYKNFKKSVDLFVFEPLDFEDNLEIFNFKDVKAKKYCLFESRTAFRFKPGFLFGLEDVDYIFCGNIISNGMDSCVILSRKNIPQKVIPGYLSLCIHETLKYYKRKVPHCSFLTVKSKFVEIAKGGILKLNKEIDQKRLLSCGIFLKGKILFLSILHTEDDLKRLNKAIGAL